MEIEGRQMANGKWQMAIGHAMLVRRGLTDPPRPTTATGQAARHHHITTSPLLYLGLHFGSSGLGGSSVTPHCCRHAGRPAARLLICDIKPADSWCDGEGGRAMPYGGGGAGLD